MRIPFGELQATLSKALQGLGLSPEDASLCARLFAETDRDGVYSHGLNRFPRFVQGVRDGIIDVRARPVLVSGGGVLERWDGQRGPGNLNAYRCMARAVERSKEHGLACVALRNTNHWMRGGSYGWQAAEAGAIGICWTNTMPNLPPWGGTEPRLGNNPLILAVPRAEGPVVLDVAMSQFSFGALEGYRRRGAELPVVGGFDTDGALSRDPAAIEKSGRVLPIGFWKGSGLSLLLDVIAATLSGGSAVHQIAPDSARETDLSQVFIAIDPSFLQAREVSEAVVSAILDHLHSGAPAGDVRYPGERTVQVRAENLRDGVPVDPDVWEQVRALA